VITAGGTRQLILWTGESVTSLAPATGGVHWRVPLLTNTNYSTATPVYDANRLLISGYMLELHGKEAQASPVWPKSKALARRILSNTSTPLLKGDSVYAAKSDGELVCLNARTGEQIWGTDKVTELKSGASIHLTLNGETVWLFTDEGTLIHARLTPEGYHELGRAHLIDPTSPFSGKKLSWVPPAYANGHVFARNDKEVICVPLMATR
jgi:hypothetical protein